MKAYVLYGANDLRLEDVPVPVISENEVLVEVKAAGICGSDIPRIYGTGAYHHPLIPGHEFSGKVVKTTESTSEWRNRRVGVFPLIPCGECSPCRNKLYEMCRSYGYLGSRRDGGFAEYVSVPADNLIELPDNVSFEEAAMLEPMAVALHAMRRASPEKEDTVCVCGLGTIGSFVTMFLKEAGIKNIFVIVSREFQKEKALSLGIPEENCIDWKAHGRITDITGGADVFFECVGKNETVSLAVDSAAPGGRVILVGNPCSDMTFEKSVYWKLLRNQLTVAGVWNSSFTHDENDDWSCVMKKLSEKKISPGMFVSHRFDMEGLEKGLHIMRDKTEGYVKIIADI